MVPLAPGLRSGGGHFLAEAYGGGAQCALGIDAQLASQVGQREQQASQFFLGQLLAHLSNIGSAGLYQGILGRVQQIITILQAFNITQLLGALRFTF